MNNVDFWLPAPDGARYLVTIATPCEDCETPAGVILRRVTRSDFGDIDASGVKLLNLRNEVAFPIVYPHKLFAKFMRLICRTFRVKDFYAIPDDIWSKIEAFDPDEVKRELFEVIDRQIRIGAKRAVKDKADV